VPAPPLLGTTAVPTPPLLGTRERPCPHRPCWEPENDRARTALVGNQRTAVPAPPLLGTRERPCPHRPCWEPENGRARSTHARDQRAGRPSVTDPARHPARRAWSVEVRECRAGPGRPPMMDPSSITDVVNLYIGCGHYSMYALHTMHNIFELKGHGGGFKLTSRSSRFYNIHAFFTIFSF
jgi:hypothetical protein